jgi:hypothetical protein
MLRDPITRSRKDLKGSFFFALGCCAIPSPAQEKT